MHQKKIFLETKISPDGKIQLPEEILSQIKNSSEEKISLEISVNSSEENFSHEEISRIAKAQHLEPEHARTLLEAEGIANNFPGLAARLKSL